MDVIRRREPEAGFTLIESVVAMGLFTGAVFLLVTVFGRFTLDDFPSQTDQALAIAERQLTNAQMERVFTSSKRDTLGFLVTQSAGLQGGLVRLDITIASRNDPVTVYATLTALCPPK